MRFLHVPTFLPDSAEPLGTDYKGSAPVPEVPLSDASSPFGIGYSESKWIVEHVLQNVTKETGVHTVVMRLGQVTGNKVGYWNEKEWFPATVKTALFQKCLPDIEGVSTLSVYSSWRSSDGVANRTSPGSQDTKRPRRLRRCATRPSHSSTSSTLDLCLGTMLSHQSLRS